MPSVIDTLIVELEIDPKKLKRSQRDTIDEFRKLEDEAKKRGGGVESAVGGMERSFAGLQKRLLGVAALFLGGLGIERMIQQVTRLQVVTDNLGRTYGIQSQMLQRWGAAGERVGVPGSSVQQGLTALQQQRFNLRNFGDPSGVLNLSWGTRGTNNPLIAQAPNGEMLPPEQLAMNIAKWLQKAGPQGANALMRMGGLSQDFVTFLMQGPEKIKKILEETKALAPTDAEIGKFKELNEAMAATSQKAEAAARKITAEFVPALIRIMDIIGKVSDFISSPFGKSESDVVQGLNKNRPGGQSYLEEQLRRKEAELRANTENLVGAKGLYKAPLEAEQRKLTDEIRKLREQLEREKSGDATVQKQSLLSPNDDNVRVWKASLGGGGGLTWGGNVGGGRRSGSSSDMPTGGPLPDVPGGVIDRSKFAEELRQKPWLRDKIMGIAAGENMHARGNIAVMETLMNRAAMTGTSLEYQARTTGEGGYYAGYNPGALRNARVRGMIERNLDSVLAGSNVSNYATDNASSWLAQKHLRTGDFEARSGKGTSTDDLGGETYFAPGKRRLGGGRDRSHYEAWRRSIANDPARAGIPLPRARPDLRGFLDPRTRFAGGAASGGGSSQAFTVGNVHIYPQKIDGDLASTLRPNLSRFARVASANNGPA